MNHDAINRLIHEIAFPGECWHDWRWAGAADYYTCESCGVHRADSTNLKYTTDLNAALMAWLVVSGRSTCERQFCIHSKNSREKIINNLLLSISMMAGRLEECKKLMEEK